MVAERVNIRHDAVFYCLICPNFPQIPACQHNMSHAAPTVVLYTRAGCHLCDDAAALLARHGLEFDSVDIDRDAELRERYNECVPVVVIDGRERFRGRIDELLLRRLLDGRGND